MWSGAFSKILKLCAYASLTSQWGARDLVGNQLYRNPPPPPPPLFLSPARHAADAAAATWAKSLPRANWAICHQAPTHTWQPALPSTVSYLFWFSCHVQCSSTPAEVYKPLLYGRHGRLGWDKQCVINFQIKSISSLYVNVRNFLEISSSFSKVEYDLLVHRHCKCFIGYSAV